jgi:hypothetical protein
MVLIKDLSLFGTNKSLAIRANQNKFFWFISRARPRPTKKGARRHAQPNIHCISRNNRLNYFMTKLAFNFVIVISRFNPHQVSDNLFFLINIFVYSFFYNLKGETEVPSKNCL